MGKRFSLRRRQDRFRLGRRAALFVAVCCAAGSANAGDNRFRLATCEGWGQKRGFYLNFENKTEGKALCRLDSLKLILGVGDGRRWRFLVTSPNGGWRPDRDYAVHVTLTADEAVLVLDGKRMSAPGGFVPYSGALAVAETPGWASSPAEYLILQKNLHVRGGNGTRLDITLSDSSGLPIGLLLFSGQSSRRVAWDSRTPLPWSIDAVFRILMRPPLRKLSPFIDRYGQCVYADWPEKVRKDEELRADVEAESKRLAATPLPKVFDPYGGRTDLGWREKGAGFFRVVKRNGFWWLVSPEGHPCFYTGIDSAPASTWPQTPVEGREFLFAWLPPREGVWRAAWGHNPWACRKDGDTVCFHACNLIRKYGEKGWQARDAAQAVRRIRAAAFGGGGKWGAPPGVVNCPVVWLHGVPMIARHPDVFDPAVRRKIRDSLSRQMQKRLRDPLVLGWSIGNEYSEIVTPQEIRDILKKSGTPPAKRALLDYALDKLYKGELEGLNAAWKVRAENRDALYRATVFVPPAPDVEALRRVYAERYYRTLYRTVKEIDPNHLYLGFWIAPGWWVNEEDWRICARWCDVIGYDRYALEFADERLLRLLRETDKPALWGEFSAPPTYRGLRGFGRYPTWTDTEREAGAFYRKLVLTAAANPYCVGAMWFQYRDQPLTGRGPGHGEALVYGEHYAFGLVTVTDRIKMPLFREMRAANLAAARVRSDITQKHP